MRQRVLRRFSSSSHLAFTASPTIAFTPPSPPLPNFLPAAQPTPTPTVQPTPTSTATATLVAGPTPTPTSTPTAQPATTPSPTAQPTLITVPQGECNVCNRFVFPSPSYLDRARDIHGRLMRGTQCIAVGSTSPPRVSSKHLDGTGRLAPSWAQLAHTQDGTHRRGSRSHVSLRAVVRVRVC